MVTEAKMEFRYQPTSCTLLCKHVWAIMTQQADGSWRIVNCLDKDEGCFRIECAFTADHGEWPYRISRVEADGSPSATCKPGLRRVDRANEGA